MKIELQPIDLNPLPPGLPLLCAFVVPWKRVAEQINTLGTWENYHSIMEKAALFSSTPTRTGGLTEYALDCEHITDAVFTFRGDWRRFIDAAVAEARHDADRDGVIIQRALAEVTPELQHTINVLHQHQLYRVEVLGGVK